jgi:hypothetical protein
MNIINIYRLPTEANTRLIYSFNIQVPQVDLLPIVMHVATQETYSINLKDGYSHLLHTTCTTPAATIYSDEHLSPSKHFWGECFHLGSWQLLISPELLKDQYRRQRESSQDPFSLASLQHLFIISNVEMAFMSTGKHMTKR